MLKTLLLSSLAAAALTASLAPTTAAAQQAGCQEQKHDNRVVGTVLGAVGGALLGNAIGEGGGREGGTIIGGVGGAVAGNAIGGASVHCGSNQYGYYDDSGRWVPNTATAYGYYDANGRWVETQNQGYAPPPPSDRDQAYAPPPAYREAPPSAYPDHRGYDGGGYADRGHSGGAPMDTRQREDWLQTQIQQRIADGQMDERQGRHALRDLDDIRRMDIDYRGQEGRLNPDQRRDIQARLDALRSTLWADRDQAGAPPAY